MYLNRINELLERSMTESGFKFWKALYSKIPPAWDRLASSTKKYHNKSNGRVPTIAEHTYEMLYAAEKLLRTFDIRVKTQEADTILLAVTLHDAFKYGINPDEAEFTTNTHDQIMADSIVKNKETFKKVFTESQVTQIETAIRYHAGRWSSGIPNTFRLDDLDPVTLFVHFLDMMSSRDLIKIGDK